MTQLLPRHARSTRHAPIRCAPVTCPASCHWLQPSLMLRAPSIPWAHQWGNRMSVRIALAFGASLCLVACGNADAAASKGHTAASSASTNWSDATLNAAKVDYVFNAMNKMTDYALAHPDFDMDAV